MGGADQSGRRAEHQCAGLKRPRFRFDFDEPPPEQLALDAFVATLLARYGRGVLYNRVEPTDAEITELERLDAELDEAHDRAFREYHRERVTAWRAWKGRG